MKIFIDTNFLLIPAQFKVDIFAEIERICDFNHELFIIDKTIDELKIIISDKSQSGKHKSAAKLGLKLAESKIKEKTLSVHTTDGSYKDATVDRVLLDLAKNEKIIVATQDQQLKKYLRLLGIKIIDLRKKQYLVLI